MYSTTYPYDANPLVFRDCGKQDKGNKVFKALKDITVNVITRVEISEAVAHAILISSETMSEREVCSFLNKRIVLCSKADSEMCGVMMIYKHDFKWYLWIGNVLMDGEPLKNIKIYRD